jgi:L-rhamnose mutarotase
LIYDYQTKNISFIRMAKFLKDSGVKNYNFFLRLNDETLVGVDPHDPNLSDEMKLRVQAEVMTNFWYYLREVVRIPESGGSTPFLLHRANLAQMFLMELNIDIIEVLPRQHGKTIGAVCRYTWVYHWGTTNSHMIFSNKQYSDSQLNIKRFNDITELLPPYLKKHLDPKKDTNNLASIACARNNNKIDAMSTANDIASADKLGRGNTVPIIWYDEFAFLKYNSTIYAAAAPAFSKASESAKKNGTPYGKLITTTPRPLGTGLVTVQLKVS